MLGDEALARLKTYGDVRTVLDIGSGPGEHAAALRAAACEVTTIDPHHPADIAAAFPDPAAAARGPFDAVWACHVLEHQTDPGAFLRAAAAVCRPDGVLAVTVPPAKTALVGGHVSIWTEGLLLYQLILAGIDCRAARVGVYGYNISVIVRNVPARLPADLVSGKGDIERLAAFFPLPVHHGIDSNFGNIGWSQ